jgi:hypothetical protein
MPCCAASSCLDGRFGLLSHLQPISCRETNGYPPEEIGSIDLPFRIPQSGECMNRLLVVVTAGAGARVTTTLLSATGADVGLVKCRAVRIKG